MGSGNPDDRLQRFFYDKAHQHDADINLDGLAHYGLLPDFFQDVADQLKEAPRRGEGPERAVPVGGEFLEMWERVEASKGLEGAAPTGRVLDGRDDVEPERRVTFSSAPGVPTSERSHSCPEMSPSVPGRTDRRPSSRLPPRVQIAKIVSLHTIDGDLRDAGRTKGWPAPPGCRVGRCGTAGALATFVAGPVGSFGWVAMNAIFFGLKRAYHGTLRIYRHALARQGLTAARFDLLYAAREYRRHGVRQSSLRRALGVSAPTVSRMVASLEALGLLRRERSNTTGASASCS